MNRDFDQINREMIKRCCFEGSSCSSFLEDKEFVKREREINEVKIQGKESSENSSLIGHNRSLLWNACSWKRTWPNDSLSCESCLQEKFIGFIRRIYIIFLTNLFDLVECKRSKLVKCNNFHETCATIIIHSLPPQFIYFTLSSSTYPQCLQYRYYLHYISTSVCSPNIRDNRNLFSRNGSHIFFGDPSIQYL